MAAVLAVTCLHVVSCKSQDPKTRIEKVHGVLLPDGARCFQQKGGGIGPDKGSLAMFECDFAALDAWISTLKIRSRLAPLKAIGDPCVNGWNVWPTNASTFVPGNAEFSGLKRTWRGETTPVEMFSCVSPVGDWLHVEIWKASATNAVVKIYTDWN